MLEFSVLILLRPTGSPFRSSPQSTTIGYVTAVPLDWLQCLVILYLLSVFSIFGDTLAYLCPLVRSASRLFSLEQENERDHYDHEDSLKLECTVHIVWWVCTRAVSQ